MRTKMTWIVTIVLGMVVTLGGCKGDGHKDHDHTDHDPMAPAASAH